MIGMGLGLDDVWYVSRLPWLGPSIALALVVSIATSGRIARWLGVPGVVSWVLIISFGVILAGTVTPLGLEYRAELQSARSCDFSRIGPVDISVLTRPSDALFNILMFIPMGIAIGLAPSSVPKAASALLSRLIEATQLSVSALGRSCQSADVADNLTGLVVGLAMGTLASWLSRTGAQKVVSGSS